MTTASANPHYQTPIWWICTQSNSTETNRTPKPQQPTVNWPYYLLYFLYSTYHVGNETYDLLSATCYRRPTACYVLSPTFSMRPLVEIWSLYHMFVITDFWTPDTPTRTVNFVCFGLRCVAYGLLRLSCFFSFMFQQHNHLSFLFFLITDVLYVDIMCLHRKSQLLPQTNSRRSFFVRGSRWALVPNKYSKRNWNIRSSVTRASFPQNVERLEALETFTCMFRYIRWRNSEKKNLNPLSAFLFLLSYCVRTSSFPEEDWCRHHSSSGDVASSHNENSEVDCSRDKKKLNKCSYSTSEVTTIRFLQAYQTYDN